MQIDRRVFLLAMCSTPAALAGCGGGGGNSGGGGFLTKSLGIGGIFRGMLTRAVNDTFDMDISLSGTTISGAGRLIAASGTDVSAGTITGTFNGTTTSGTVTFTLTFDVGAHTGETFTMTNATYTGTSSGGVVTVTVIGPYTLGAETGNLTASKISDTTADVTGDWSGTATSNRTQQTGPITVTFTESGNHLSGNGTVPGVQTPVPISGFIIGDKITYGAVGGLNISFTATVTGKNNVSKAIDGTYSGSDSGTFHLARSGSSS